MLTLLILLRVNTTAEAFRSVGLSHLTHNETLSVRELLKKLPEVFVALLVGGTQDLQRTETKTEK